MCEKEEESAWGASAVESPFHEGERQGRLKKTKQEKDGREEASAWGGDSETKGKCEKGRERERAEERKRDHQEPCGSV